MRLSGYAKSEWLTILAIGAILSLTAAAMGWWILLALVMVATLAVLSFFRDPHRRTPVQRALYVAPADGRVSSVHEVADFEPLGGPATCIRIFLSVLDVHVQRSPCHGAVARIKHRPGQFRNALNPASAEVNNALTMVLLHPVKRHPVAAVRQISGLLARTIVCDVRVDEVLQRGQRYGMIKLGSTVELYIPAALQPRPTVKPGDRVRGGSSVVCHIATTRDDDAPAAESAAITSAA